MKQTFLSATATAFFMGSDPDYMRIEQEFLTGLKVKPADYQNFIKNLDRCNQHVFSMVSTHKSDFITSSFVQVYPCIGKQSQTAQMCISGLVQLKSGKVAQFKELYTEWPHDSTQYSRIIEDEIYRFVKGSAKQVLWQENFNPERSLLEEYDPLRSFPGVKTVGRYFDRILGYRIMDGLNLQDLNHPPTSKNDLVLPWTVSLKIKDSGKREFAYHCIDEDRALLRVISEPEKKVEYCAPILWHWSSNTQFPLEIERVDWNHYRCLIESCIYSHWNDEWAASSRAAFGAFEQTLDPIYHRLNDLGIDSKATRFTWVMGGWNAKEKERRCQAVEAFPMLLDFYFQSLGVADQRKLEQAIMDGVELIPFLAQTFEISIYAVRKLKLIDKDFSEFSRFLERGIYSLRLVKEILSIQAYPDNSLEDWKSFFIAIENIAAWTTGTFCIWTKPEHFLCEENWIWKSKGLNRGELTGIYEFTRDFATQCLFPVAVKVLEKLQIRVDRANLTNSVCTAIDDYSTLELVLTSRLKLSKLLTLSKIWHRDHEMIWDQIVVDPIQAEWPKLFESKTIGEFTACCLITAEQLKEEGSKMRHCVGSFSSECLFNRSHIISLTDPKGNRVSTIQIALDCNENKFTPKVIQHFGQGNSDASEQAEIAAAELIDQIISGGITVDFDGLEQAFQARNLGKKSSDLTNIIGYDPMDKEALNRVMQAWSFAFPNELKGLDYWSWAEKLNLEQLITDAVLADEARRLAMQQDINVKPTSLWAQL